ncbi:Sorting nexin mvp1 [Steccherinum ochraceum]|uniref:Sorting nexin MVP1 n=1 Tax=Steccherinum ochraceum TaxID=92696 RepID=A0A4R0S2L0_9APHY|nr:Sorting nexin mvp1 [Steccherinum ochraceum]
MFNAPRPSQSYGTSPGGNFGGSFVVDNPLASSVYDSDGLDPWSTAPSPAPPPLPTSSLSATAATSGFSSVLGEATIPAIYHQAFAAVDNVGSGETSVNALTRVLETSSVSASSIDKIVSLVSTRSRVSKQEFFIALALVALAQSGKDVSIERVAALAQDNALPLPDLNLGALSAGTSTFNAYQPTVHAPIPQRSYTSDDPWTTAKFTAPQPSTNGSSSIVNGGPSSIAGTGLPKDWWKKQEVIHVNTLGQHGFLLNRYLVYEVSSNRGASVPRRYSEFVILWDCLVKRYPFRLLPALPPKRIGPDESFLEQRRRGLARFLNFVVNHPVIKEDGLLSVFLTEPSFETWRKNTPISYDEESASKRVDRVEEMSIPSDLQDKLAIVRNKIAFLIEHWQKICILAERIIKRREAVAVRLSSSPFEGRNYMPAHFTFPPFSPVSQHTTSTVFSDSASLTSSIFSGLAMHRSPPDPVDAQGDLARMSNTVKALVEVNERCWRGDDCELCSGVRQGLGTVAQHTQRHSDALEDRTRTLLYSTLEALKSQRDLYLAMRDLFIRHDRLSGDQVDKLKKRVETNSLKLEGVKQAAKENWQVEADKISVLIEKDQAAISNALNRRVFIRASMWHELRVVLHNRENTLVTQAVKSFAQAESVFAENATANWSSLLDGVEGMPFE